MGLRRMKMFMANSRPMTDPARRTARSLNRSDLSVDRMAVRKRTNR